MQFSEANDFWCDIPDWARFMIRFGYCWPNNIKARRRLILISMPCDSAASGLIALGALRKYLEDSSANDIEFHRQRIWDEEKKIPQNRKILLHKNKRYHGYKFRYHGKNHDGLDEIIEIPRAGKKSLSSPFIMPVDVKDVYFEKEPCLEVDTGHELSFGDIYRNLVDHSDEFLDSNLKKTYSGVCLAGRKMGENLTREIMSSIRFCSGSEPVQLDQLLSVHDWSSETISRMSFYNSRTQKIDRQSASLRLVVADGDAAFLTVYNDKDILFGDCDIIAVIDRTLERDRLDAIVEKMSSLSQWYDTDHFLPENLPPVPKGVSLAIWKKR